MSPRPKFPDLPKRTNLLGPECELSARPSAGSTDEPALPAVTPRSDSPHLPVGKVTFLTIYRKQDKRPSLHLR